SCALPNTFSYSLRGASSPRARRRPWWTIRALWKPIPALPGSPVFRPQEARMSDALLAVSGLAAGYGAIEVLRGIDLEVAAGEIVAVLGSNGAGKSTLNRTISGVLRPTHGSIRFAGGAIEREKP